MPREVESIARINPKAPSEHEGGLLEYLEDIIGTSQYKGPIDEALGVGMRVASLFSVGFNLTMTAHSSSLLPLRCPRHSTMCHALLALLNGYGDLTIVSC